jgi:RNA polymerase sigma-70 factor (ECF subfamily)
MNDKDKLIPTRKSLLSRLKNWDDQESWRDFFDTYWQLIYRAGVKAGLTEAEAEDVVQETVICALKSMKDFHYAQTNSSFKSWLLRLTSWRIKDQMRKRVPHIAASRRDHAATETATIEKLADPATLEWEEAWENDWELNLLHAAIQRLKKRVDSKTYQIFDLLVFKDLPVARVAQGFQISRAKVYLIKHRVSKLLKAEVDRLRHDGELAALRPSNNSHFV